MPESNLELARAGFQAFAEGGVEALLPYIHPEFEMTTPAGLAAEPDTYRGHAGVRRYFDSFDDAMTDVRLEPHEFHQVGELVVVEFTLRARGASTGIDAAIRAAQVWEVRDGKAVRVELFVGPEEALAYARGRAGEE